MHLSHLRLTFSAHTAPAMPPTPSRHATLRGTPAMPLRSATADIASRAPPSQHPRVTSPVPSATMSGVAADADQWIKVLREQHVERCVWLRRSVVPISFGPSVPIEPLRLALPFISSSFLRYPCLRYFRLGSFGCRGVRSQRAHASPAQA